MDRGAWWVTVHGVTESDTNGQLGTHTYTSKKSRYVDINYFLKSNGIIINILKKISPPNHSQLKMVN